MMSAMCGNVNEIEFVRRLSVLLKGIDICVLVDSQLDTEQIGVLPIF